VYKYIIILILTLITSGCTGIAKVRERHHRAPFEKQIEMGTYDIVLYNVIYPENYEDKIKFYENFDIVMKKLLVYDTTVNIMYPERFKDDILLLRNGILLPEEQLFAKVSSELSPVEKELIDKKVPIKLDKNVGDSQYYLNKQVYFWKKIVKDNEKFDSKKTYTELDKERLILDMKEKRKEMFNILNEVKLNLVLRIEEPYKKSKEEYWQEKDVYIDRPTKLVPKVFVEDNYIYLDDVSKEDVKKIVGEQLKFNSKIVIIENDLYKGYEVVDGKYIFYTGGKYILEYYEGYRINIVVKDVNLVDLLKIDEKLLIDDFLNPNSYKERQEK